MYSSFAPLTLQSGVEMDFVSSTGSFGGTVTLQSAGSCTNSPATTIHFANTNGTLFAFCYTMATASTTFTSGIIGTDVFQFRFKDNYGAYSNYAYLTITVSNPLQVCTVTGSCVASTLEVCCTLFFLHF